MLDRLFAAVPAIRAYLQRIFGYALTGLTTEQCFFIFHGIGSNGKSTILNAILDLLGEYADASRPETFMIKRHDGGIPNDVAALTGVRYVVSLESEKDSTSPRDWSRGSRAAIRSRRGSSIRNLFDLPRGSSSSSGPIISR